MRSQSAILLAMLVVFLLYGCTVQNSFPATKAENAISVQKFDLDGDGAIDLMIYDFSPVSYDNHTVKRQLAVAVRNDAAFSSFRNLTDLQLINIRSRLDSFASGEALAFESCASNAGLKKDCTDATSCAVLCTGSFKCNKIADNFKEAIAGSMVDFVDERNHMDNQLLDIRNTVLGLRAAGTDQKNAYLGKVLGITGSTAGIYANPMYNRQELMLCSRSDSGLSVLTNTTREMGDYNATPSYYDYFVTIWVSGDDQKQAASSIEAKDSVPLWALSSADDLASHQQIEVAQNASSYTISWESERSSPAGSMLAYRFKSAKGPELVVPELRSPALIVNTLDLRIFAVPETLFNAIYGASHSFFIALGASLSLTLVLLLLAYNLAMIGYYAARSKMAGGSVLSGMRKAFGRTEARWKTDLIMGALLLAAGYYISAFVAKDSAAPSSLFGSLDYFTNLALSTAAAAGLAGVGCIFLGLLLIYTAAENRVRIAVLEKAYGAAIMEEKEDFVSRVVSLKGKMAELQRLLDSTSSDEFDVSGEYDVLASISPQRVDELAKKATPEAGRMIDKDLADVEAAIERLTEKKKTAAESWPKWSESIDKLLSEQEEVYVTSLINVPASLRAWALGRYAKEHAADGVVFERDTLRRRKFSPDALIGGMVKDGLLNGAVVVLNEELSAAHMAKGAATVPAALSLRLRSYLRSFAKSQGQAEPTSFAAVGDKMVLVMMREGDLESTLFIPREKFKDAIEEWKKKTKMLGGGAKAE